MSITSQTVVATHTASANARNPGMCTGNVAPAVATMPVPMTEANQFGPRKLQGRCRSVVAIATSSRRSEAVRGFSPGRFWGKRCVAGRLRSIG
jgi:hypothetical protein